MLPADFTFDVYPIIVAVGVLLALVIFDFFFRKKNLKRVMATDFEILFVVAAAIGVIFAILFQNLYDLIEDPANYHWTWAMTFFGGLVGGVGSFFAGYFLVLRKHYPTALAPVTLIAGGCVPLAHGIGRIACTMDGCCYGMTLTEDNPFYWIGVVFRTTHGHVVVPTQLFEAVFLLTLSSILILLAFKKETLLTLPIYMISYGIWRFLIEFLRDDHRGNFIPGITPSQFWAIVLFIGGVTYLVILLKSKKTHMRDYELPYNEAVKTQE